MYTRRKFFAAAGITTAAALGQPSQLLSSMPKAKNDLGKVRITDIKIAVLNLKYLTTFVKVTTDSGLYGLGEAFPKVDISGFIGDLKEQIVGEDPLNVEYLYEKMMDELISRGSRTGALCGAIAGVETALLDLTGKILNAPVYVLLGGKYRDKVCMYHDAPKPSGNAQNDPGAWADAAQESLESGFTISKFSLRRIDSEKWNRYLPAKDISKYVNIMEAIRSQVGPHYPIGVDLHWRHNTRDGMRFVKSIEHLNLMFVEDPLPPENADAFARLTATSSVPIMTGENLFTRHGFRPFIEKQACDYIHPDAQKCGGLLETKKISDWSDLYYMNMFCHNLSTPLGTVASGHACMAIKNFIALEEPGVRDEYPEWDDMIVWDGPIYRNGNLEIPDKPGLGVRLNNEVVKKFCIGDTGFFR
jgi:L-alanine-DL-glutamate epimerase-like enolase superfamily enzyme